MLHTYKSVINIQALAELMFSKSTQSLLSFKKQRQKQLNGLGFYWWSNRPSHGVQANVPRQPIIWVYCTQICMRRDSSTPSSDGKFCSFQRTGSSATAPKEPAFSAPKRLLIYDIMSPHILP